MSKIITNILIIIVVLGLLLFLKMKNNIRLVLILGVIIGSIFLGILLLLSTLFYFDSNEIEIKVSVSDNPAKFILKEKNRRLGYEYWYTKFSTNSSLDELEVLVKETYPDDIVEMNNNEIRILHNNIIVRLEKVKEDKFLWQSRNIYTLETEFISVDIVEGEFVYIPFSKRYLDIEGVYSTRMKIKCSIDELKEYYKGFTNVEFEDESIILELDKPVKLTIEDDELVISYK